MPCPASVIPSPFTCLLTLPFRFDLFILFSDLEGLSFFFPPQSNPCEVLAATRPELTLPSLLSQKVFYNPSPFCFWNTQSVGLVILTVFVQGIYVSFKFPFDPQQAIFPIFYNPVQRRPTFFYWARHGYAVYSSMDSPSPPPFLRLDIAVGISYRLSFFSPVKIQ